MPKSDDGVSVQQPKTEKETPQVAEQLWFQVTANSTCVTCYNTGRSTGRIKANKESLKRTQRAHRQIELIEVMLCEVRNSRVPVDLHEAVRWFDIAHNELQKRRFTHTIGYRKSSEFIKSQSACVAQISLRLHF